MATGTDLVSAMAKALGVERSSVTVAAQQLQLDTDVAMTADDAATLLIGFLGTCATPKDARVFGDLPAVAAVYQETTDGRVTRVAHDIDGIPIASGEETGHAALTRSLIGALSDIIGVRAQGHRNVQGHP